jgi:hypothetical protein
MKLSANIMAYVVLVVAVVLVGVYVTGIDTSTDVSTLEESLLPNVYPPEGQSITPDIRGVSFRYPAGWQVTSTDETLTLARPVDRFDASAGQYAFGIRVAQQEGEAAIAPVDLLPENFASAEITELERGGLPAVNAIVSAPEGVAVFDAVQLSEENIFFQMGNQGPISQDAWEDISDDIDGVLNSIRVEDVTVVADAFTFTLAEGWAEFDSGRDFFTVVIPDAQAPEAGMQVVVLPPDRALQAVSSILPVTPGTVDLTIAPDPLTAMELYAELPEHPVEFTQEVQDVSLFGLQGKGMGYTSPEINDTRITVLDPEDGYYVFVLVNILSDEPYETYADDIQSILDSIDYTTPDASFFEQ